MPGKREVIEDFKLEVSPEAEQEFLLLFEAYPFDCTKNSTIIRETQDLLNRVGGSVTFITDEDKEYTLTAK